MLTTFRNVGTEWHKLESLCYKENDVIRTGRTCRRLLRSLRPTILIPWIRTRRPHPYERFMNRKNVHKKGVFRFCVRFDIWGYTCLGLGLSVCTKLFEIFMFGTFLFAWLWSVFGWIFFG